MTTIDLDEAERMHEPRSPAHEDADIAAHARTFVPLAVARIRELEAARDAFRAQAEASLVVPCACGRPMPSVSSRLRCDACRAEGERDEARAQVAAMQARAERAEAALGRVLDWTVTYGQQLCPPPGVFDTYGEGMRVAKRHAASIANSSGAPLLAELRALRAFEAVSRAHSHDDLAKALAHVDEVRAGAKGGG